MSRWLGRSRSVVSKNTSEVEVARLTWGKSRSAGIESFKDRDRGKKEKKCEFAKFWANFFRPS